MIVTMEEAQKSLPDLIARLKPGDTLIITQDASPVAQVVPVTTASPVAPSRHPGSAKGILTITAEDDEHLEDFREYTG